MSKTIKKSKSSITFKHPITVEVRTLEFKPLASLDFLDVDRLSKGSHKIEIGVVKGGCCSKLVRATIRKGMVTGIEVEPCKDTKRASPELFRLLKEAHPRIAPKAGTKFQPVPVGEFLGSAAVRAIDVDLCITICIFGICGKCCFYSNQGPITPFRCAEFRESEGPPGDLAP